MSPSKQHLAIAVAITSLLIAGCNKAEEQWQKTKTEDTAEAYARFISDYPKSDLSSEAKTRLKSKRLSFVLASREPRALQSYLELYPGDEDPQLVSLAEELRWKQLGKTSTESEWRAFLEDFPFSKYAASIKQHLTQLATEANWRFQIGCPQTEATIDQVREKSRLAKSRPAALVATQQAISATTEQLRPGRYVGKSDDGLTFSVELCRDMTARALRLQNLSLASTSASDAQGAVVLSQLQGVGSKVYGDGNEGRVDFCFRAITAHISFQPGTSLLSMSGSSVSVQLETRGEYVGSIAPDGVKKARLDLLKLSSPLSDALDFGIVAIPANQSLGGVYKVLLEQDTLAKPAARAGREWACLPGR